MSASPVLVALGATTSIGRTAWSSAAAVRAGVNRFDLHPTVSDAIGKPIQVARAGWLDANLAGVERFAALLLPAIEQAIEPLDGGPLGARRVAVALGLPSPRPGLDERIDRRLAERVREACRDRVGHVETFVAGHAAGLVALEAACRLLGGGEFDACVVAGVDSYLDPVTLEWLEHSDQLHGAGRLNNAWGFIPGEAAGALLVMSASAAASVGLSAWGRVIGIGTAFEARRIKTKTVCIGEGLTDAFRGALARLPGDALVTDICCDLNGEPYRADEYAFAALRTKSAFRSMSEFVAPADCWGDVAAASGPLHMMLMIVAGLKRYARGDLGFAWSSAEGGERAAALVGLGSAS